MIIRWSDYDIGIHSVSEEKQTLQNREVVMIANRIGVLKRCCIVVVFTLMPAIYFNACSNDKSQMVVIGILNLTSALEDCVTGFKKGMADMGYEEGRNIKYIYPGPAGSIKMLEPAAQKLLAQKVDLIYSLSTPATETAKKVTKGTDVPVVFGPVTDPVSSGLVNSLRHPGGNLTGVSSGIATSKSLEWFKRLFPDLKTIMALHNPNDSSSVQSLKSLIKTAQSLELSIVVSEVQDRAGLESSIQAVPEVIDGLYVLPSAVVTLHTDLIIRMAVEQKMLTASTAHISQKGIAVTYGVQYFALGGQASRIANQIIKGSHPSDLPVQLAEFYLYINLKTIKAVGSDVQEAHLAQADGIIN